MFVVKVAFAVAFVSFFFWLGCELGRLYLKSFAPSTIAPITAPPPARFRPLPPLPPPMTVPPRLPFPLPVILVIAGAAQQTETTVHLPYIPEFTESQYRDLDTVLLNLKLKVINKKTECSICLNDRNWFAKFDCGHDLCVSCVSKLEKRQCPLCRAPFEVFGPLVQ